MSTSGDYLGSSEELTPLTHDLRSSVPVAIAATATLMAPTSWTWFAAGSVANYALSEQGWEDIVHGGPSVQRQHGRPSPVPGRIQSNQGRASRTAALMAVQRGLESTRPPQARLFTDPLARSFLPPSWRAALVASRIGAVRDAVEAAYDFIGGPGPRASAIARTKLIDDLVEQIAPTVEQFVLLGAGYDTRPYRLACLASCAVFEVDEPDTQAVKRTTLSRADVNTSGVVFVGVDFETDDLAVALTGANYVADKPTLFVWEGVTQYLSADAVDNTLAVIHKIAHAGGRLSSPT